MFEEWKDKINEFKKIDVRGVEDNFFKIIKKYAMSLDVLNGIEVIQTFEPIPLYEVMERLGYEYKTIKYDDGYHTYFYRLEKNEESENIINRPISLINIPLIDNELSDISIKLWDITWNDNKNYLPYEMRLLLSLMNAVGAKRMHQATRELVKAYLSGIDSRALDDCFKLIIWNYGVAYFYLKLHHHHYLKHIN